MKCYLCASGRAEQIHDRCRDSDQVKVMRCQDCGLVFLSSAASISDEFYEKSGMYEFEVPDRASLLKEEEADTVRRLALLEPLVRGKRYLDFGCGAGAVAEGLGKQAASVAAVELNQAHREALRKLGVNACRSLSELGGTFDVITLFHVLEHLKDPVGQLAELRERLSPGGRIVVEVPHADDALLSRYDCAAFKNFTYWTCHLFLFTESTLRETLRKAGFGATEVRFTQRYPFANHLYWLAKGKPGGHKLWANHSSSELDAAYARKLAELKATDTLVAISSV